MGKKYSRKRRTTEWYHFHSLTRSLTWWKKIMTHLTVQVHWFSINGFYGCGADDELCLCRFWRLPMLSRQINGHATVTESVQTRLRHPNAPQPNQSKVNRSVDSMRARHVQIPGSLRILRLLGVRQFHMLKKGESLPADRHNGDSLWYSR